MHQGAGGRELSRGKANPREPSEPATGHSVTLAVTKCQMSERLAVPIGQIEPDNRRESPWQWYSSVRTDECHESRAIILTLEDRHERSDQAPSAAASSGQKACAVRG